MTCGPHPSMIGGTRSWAGLLGSAREKGKPGLAALGWASGCASRKAPFPFSVLFLEFFYLSNFHFYLTQASYMCILKCQVCIHP
jgi:hypothetical protein